MITQTTLAGQKIEHWRNAQAPRVTRQALADRFGCDQSGVAKWEREGKRPQEDVVVNWFAENGIATHADWYVRAPAYPANSSGIAFCGQCDARAGSPQVRQCSRADCGMVGQKFEEAA